MIGPYKSNSDHFAFSHDVVIQFGRFVKLASEPGAVPGDLPQPNHHWASYIVGNVEARF